MQNKQFEGYSFAKVLSDSNGKSFADGMPKWELKHYKRIVGYYPTTQEMTHAQTEHQRQRSQGMPSLVKSIA